MSETHSIQYPSEFQDIAPYSDCDYKEALDRLCADPGFENAVKFIMPGVDYAAFVRELAQTVDQDDFQRRMVGRFLEMLAAKTTAGITMDGVDNVKPGVAYTYMSNHRDIVLDASFLNLCFIRSGLPITQIAIGNNLLIYDWIRELVKINRSFIVIRDAKRLQAIEVARQLSRYIHYVVDKRHESIWIAQRQGRAKDSNDTTQESLLKMLSLGSDGTFKESIAKLNIIPVSISYEYDPNDYLKVREYVLKQRDPEFKKSQRDDLFSMETGLLAFKGHVHFTLNRPLNETLKDIDTSDRHRMLHDVRDAIDSEIHAGYKIYPINYIAYSLLHGTHEFDDRYTASQKQEFEEYVNRQLERVDIDNPTPDERAYMRRMMLTMYANPLVNKLGSCR